MEPKKTANKAEAKAATVTCGLVMPIGPIDQCSADHWAEVKAILTEAVESISDPPFSVRLVSDADDIGIIQKRIVQNVYTSDILLCDVSGKNPNVMFELGMRLAFDKPVVIVKDDKTDYAFDTGIIEHVPYPRDLRFAKIVEFKTTVAAKVAATYNASRTPDHSPFLKNFGKFQVANLDETTVTPERLVLEQLDELRQDFRRMQRRMEGPDSISPRKGPAAEFFSRVAAILPGAVERANVPSPKALLGNEDFYQRVEGECEAPRYFDSPTQFRRALDQFLRAQP